MLAVIAVSCIFACLGLVLGHSARRFEATGNSLAERIDALLPQTQCGRCGFPGCRPYAEAIARGTADINRCPPGGAEGVRALAELLGVESKPLDASHGVEKPKSVALIDEAVCIGCTLCIQACPVDAILGAPRSMHTVIEAECTGCELCLPTCPVDCIHMEPVRKPAEPLWNGDPDEAGRLIPGGPIMSHALPCIRCGACADACPASLLPQQLYWHARSGHSDRLESHHLFDCTECGGCDLVCPSQIRLVSSFRAAKGKILARRHERQSAEQARQRYTARLARHEQEKRERAETARRQKERLGKATAPEIREAIERAKARRSGKTQATLQNGVHSAGDPSEAPHTPDTKVPNPP